MDDEKNYYLKSDFLKLSKQLKQALIPCIENKINQKN